MERDFNIDFLRAVGLCLIILAHVSCPQTLFGLRTFDVPLMCFVSGLAYSGRSLPSPMLFYSKRILRLLVPVYIFLVFYFMAVALMGRLPDLQTILRTFLLLDGIGYVWIIRVFLLQMIIMPFMQILQRKMNCGWSGRRICFLMMAFAGYEYFYQQTIYIMPRWLGPIVYYALGYGFIFFVGYNMNATRIKHIFALLFVWVFTAVMISYKVRFDPQSFKYPPHGLFIAYGVACSISLFLLLRSFPSLASIVIFCPASRKIVEYISRRTIWIYLWHIPMLDIVFYANIQSWMIRWAVVSSGACLLVFLQVRIVKLIAYHMRSKQISSFLLNYLTK